MNINQKKIKEADILPELNQWEGNELRLKYDSLSKDFLLNKVLRLEEMIKEVNNNLKKIKFTIVSNVSIIDSNPNLAKGYQDLFELNILITENEKHECKEDKSKEKESI